MLNICSLLMIRFAVWQKKWCRCTVESIASSNNKRERKRKIREEKDNVRGEEGRGERRGEERQKEI